MSDSIAKVPEHILPGLVNYAVWGRWTGGFLEAVLSNDLREALGRADVVNRAAMFEITGFLYNDMPAGCSGSPDRYKVWREGGGLVGIAGAVAACEWADGHGLTNLVDDAAGLRARMQEQLEKPLPGTEAPHDPEPDHSIPIDEEAAP